jgi:hypothetical protein
MKQKSILGGAVRGTITIWARMRKKGEMLRRRVEPFGENFRNGILSI